MTYLLDWASTGTDVLVGVTDPTDASRGVHVVPGRVERDWQDLPVLRFTLPCGGAPETVDARRVADTSGVLHLTTSGDGWALIAFAADSEAHLRWQIREAQHAILQLVGDRLIADPQASRRLAELAGALNVLVCRAALLAEPATDRSQAVA